MPHIKNVELYKTNIVFIINIVALTALCLLNIYAFGKIHCTPHEPHYSYLTPFEFRSDVGTKKMRHVESLWFVKVSAQTTRTTAHIWLVKDIRRYRYSYNWQCLLTGELNFQWLVCRSHWRTCKLQRTHSDLCQYFLCSLMSCVSTSLALNRSSGKGSSRDIVQ